MRAAHPEQQQRLYAKLCRELGAATLAALGDPDVTEVMCNPDGALWVESHAKGMRDLGDRLTENQVESLIGTVAALLGSVVHGRAPIVEGELPINGYRFEGILPPVSTAPTFVIRKRASQIYGLDDYVKAGILTPAQQKVLVDGVRDRRNILIAGGTASGKTTLANALMREIVSLGDPTERIVILEDTRELQCEARNAVQLHTGDVADLTRLVRVTMRLRPDRIIVGEVRGGEALALLKAWNTGHPGGITTVHANSAAAALLRLDSLIQESGVPPQPRLVAEAIDLVAFIVRTPDGRRVREMARVSSYDPARGSYVLEPVEPVPMEVDMRDHRRLLILPVCWSVLLLESVCSVAEAAATGPAMPWDGPLNTILSSLSGTVAHVLITVAVIVTGLVFAFTEHGSGARRLFGVAFGGALALGALSFMTAVGWAGATF